MGHAPTVADIERPLKERIAALEAERDGLKAERDEATNQVQLVLNEKRKIQANADSTTHNMLGLVNWLDGWWSIAEERGIPLPKKTGIPRTDAVVLLNAAMTAADGKVYLSSAEAAEYRKSIRELQQRADAAEAKLAAVREWIDKEAMPRYVELLEAAGINPETSVLVKQAQELLK